MARWKIFYADGSSFSDQDGGPCDAPKFGAVVCLIEEGRFGRRKLALDWDYFIYSPTLGYWTGQRDAAGALLRQLQEPWSVTVACFWDREAAFEKILIAADNDPYLAPRQDAPPPHPVWNKE